MKCQKMADLAMADLAEAMPALEEARKALESLNKKVSFRFDIKSIFKVRWMYKNFECLTTADLS